MRRYWLVWTGFLLCLAVALTAMAWVSLAAVRLDRDQAAAQRQAALEENVRLALWRADSMLAPWVAQESVRPWFAYRAFLPADRAYGAMFNNDRPGGERVLPSPLLAATPPHVLVHFQFEPDGRLTSPQVPGKEITAAAAPLGVSQETVRRFRAHLDEVRSLVDRKTLLDDKRLRASPAEPVQVLVSRPAAQPAPPQPTAAGVNTFSPPAKPAPPTLAGNNTLSPAPNATVPAPLQQPAAIAQQAYPAQQFQPQPQLANSPLYQTVEQRAVVKNRRADIQQKIGQGAVEYDVRNSLINAAPNAPGNFDNNGTQFGQIYFASPTAGNGANLTVGSGANLTAGGTVITNVQPTWTFNGSQATLTLNGTLNGGVLTLPSTDMSGVPMTPLWIGGQLILARRIVAGGQEYVQGCLLDWPGIKAVLLETISDLLPEADFEPVAALPADSPAAMPADEGRMLAALPVRLVADRLPNEGDQRLSPILLSLAVAWTCMALAAAAVAGLVVGVLRLSERRASFVTAVTHELRTPLTTFQMYAEMLAEGMVPEGPEQHQYLVTLRTEAVRLTHLVENVLCYARLERGRADGRRESLPLGLLVGRIAERLHARAEQSGMRLVVEGDDAARAAIVRANPSAVEQILFNLLDNACKYASGSDDPRLHLVLALGRDTAEVSLGDHGPGVAASVRRRLFRPFSKSAREAAHSAPGVGLGLALSRRLARDMGGDLRLDAAAPGARFLLLLPLDRG
jgi:signal transduction histidine kinase